MIPIKSNSMIPKTSVCVRNPKPVGVRICISPVSQRPYIRAHASSSDDVFQGSGDDSSEDLSSSGQPSDDPNSHDAPSFYEELSRYSSDSDLPHVSSDPPPESDSPPALSSPSSSGGDVEVQDALTEVLMLSIRKEKVKEEIRADLETKKQRLRSIGDELNEQFSREIELDKMRAELASNMSLAETMEKFQQLEDEVQAVRDRLKADKKDLADWEEQNAASRNEGLFFKRLHKASRRGEDSSSQEGLESADPFESDVQQARKKVILRSIKEPAEKELHSPWRLYVFAYLSLVSTLVLLQDLFGDDPSFGTDAIYGIITLIMLFNVAAERSALKASEDRDVGS